jgi:uncharacterized membrane protein
MFSDPVLRKSIFAGVITSILVILFIQPILNLVGKIIIWFGNNLYEGFNNSLYKQAAFGLNERYSFILLLLFVSALTGVMAGFIVGIILPNSKEEKKSSLDKVNKKNY